MTACVYTVLCISADCPARTHCLRATARPGPDKVQQYASLTWKKRSGKCSEFVENATGWVDRMANRQQNGTAKRIRKRANHGGRKQPNRSELW